ncbi:hypothetical protein DFH07DRAFT_962981 [Mycena maculata]|uniref:E3 ubiquitin-protein ligase listerin n=1 Tax=Mycena maculata TaxID=230809 RepID=A0AAD7IMG1_9AGAR|nr:hypothetical protein DFH07DRAFT_962981 [Mycena maculata]
MAPKSSASAGTRKKHARKAAGPVEAEPARPPQRGEKKTKKHRSDPPRAKAYVAPSKPAPATRDPLDEHGLAHRLPPDLLVVLRSLGKKAVVTKARALEELMGGWVGPRVAREEEYEDGDETLLLMAPVWLHHLPAHLLHPDRRIRALTASLHATLLRIPALSTSPLSPDECSANVLGTWALAAHDPDRTVATAAASARMPTPPAVLAPFLEQVLLDPDALDRALNPPVVAAPPHPKGGNNNKGRAAARPTGRVEPAPESPRSKDDREELESEGDRCARVRIAAFGALRWMLENTPWTASAALPPWLASPRLWSALCDSAPASSLPASSSATPRGADDSDDEEGEGGDDSAEQGAGGEAEEPLGHAQPVLRRAAWACVPAVLAALAAASSSANSDLITTAPADEGEAVDITSIQGTLARAALGAAWREADGGVQGAMWPGVLGVLRDTPHPWLLAPSPSPSPSASTSNSSSQPHSHSHYASFLADFLARACGGAPASAYPSVVVVVASVPAELLAPTHTLFAAFWAALGGPPGSPSPSSGAPDPGSGAAAPAPALATALPAARARAGAAFVGALLECAVFVVRRGRAGLSRETEARRGRARLAAETAGAAGAALVAREVGRVWGALAAGPGGEAGGRIEGRGDGGKEKDEDEEGEPGETDKEKERGPRKERPAPLLHIEARRAAGLLRHALGGAGAVGGDLLDAGLGALGACVRGGWAVRGDAPLVCAVLGALVGEEDAVAGEEGKGEGEGEGEGGDPAAKLTPAAAAARISTYGRALAAEVLGAAAAAEDAPFLVRALGAFGARAFEFGGGVAEALDALLARRAYALLLTAPALLFAYLAHRAPRRQTLYSALLADVAAHPEAAGDALGALAGAELAGLAAVGGPLDALFAAPAPAPVPVPVLAQVLRRGALFLSPAAGRAARARVVEAFAGRVEAALGAADAEGRVPLRAFDADVQLLGGVVGAGAGEVEGALFPAVYVLAHVLPRAYAPEEREAGAGAVGAARGMWARWCEAGDARRRAEVHAEVARRLRVMVCSTDVCVTPEDILDALAEGTLGAPIDVVTAVFPSRADLDAMLDALPADPPAASLAVLHPHLPPASALRTPKRAPAHDTRGYAAYARIVAALLRALAADRRAAKEHVWALRHVLALALYAEDHLAVPAAPSAVFDAAAPALDGAALAALGARAQQLATYLLTVSVEDGWRPRLLAAVTNDRPLVGGGALPGLVVDLIGCARRTERSRDCRVLGRVLRHVLQDADKAEVDLWMVLAKKIEKSAPETCIAIVSAISDSTLEPPRLERYRNELAADLLGIPPSKANTQGLLTLRKLAASAPDGDSDVVFLPQQRSVNIFKACQQWVASDEDIEEELESAMTLVFFHLAPLLQNVPGTHWDLIFDVVESNLENAALTDDETLVTLARTLRLIILIQDLALTNKTLRASWEERQMQVLTMVRDLAAGQLDGVAASAPRSTCRELVLSIVQDLPSSLITEDTLPKMCHLLADPSVDVQKIAYQLLGVAARKRTEHFVIEAGVDVDAVVKADLPLELLDILQTSLNLSQGDSLDLEESTVFGYLLGWMVVFDLFTDASLKVKLSYIDQLRTLDIIGTSFIPNLLSLLGVDQGIPKAFKLDPWAVDEYFVQLYESGSPWSLQVLAAHLYYRALLTVPSLIYNWVLDCKDRQLSSSIATYTSLHFSPVIIRAELAYVKNPEVTADLVDENLTIKVAAAVNEVVASYLVDEHQLEIKLKIPSDWPLHKIEVKDVQRVGVEETRWRAWILAVQQTLWSQNGRIVDGIGLFKKNVTLHFEGQVECAICYS